MELPSSVRIIEDVDQVLEALENVYCTHKMAVEGLENQNGNRQPVVGDEKIER